MKARFVFNVVGQKEAIEVLYHRMASSLGDARLFEVNIEGIHGVQEADVVDGELIFVDLDEKFKSLPKVTKIWHKSTNKGYKTTYM